jgi:hypothetical protein
MNKKPKTKGALYEHLSKIGSMGGLKSRRKLTRKDAKAMAEKSAEARRKKKQAQS